eukprot:m.469303 g.469303  ORF g.469303 m.469303 type:complete len:456 (-) comp28376_c0_seq1:296-1663(-)
MADEQPIIPIEEAGEAPPQFDIVEEADPVEVDAPNFEYGLKQNVRIGIPPALWKPDPHYHWQYMTKVHQQVHTAPDPVMERAHKASTIQEPMMARGFPMNSEVKFFEKETPPKDNDPTYNSNVDNIKGKGDKWYGFHSFNLDWQKADEKFEGPSLNPIITVRPLLNPTDRIWLNTAADLRAAEAAVRKAHGIRELGGSRDLGESGQQRADRLEGEVERREGIIDQQHFENEALTAEVDELHEQIAQFDADGGDVAALMAQLRDAQHTVADVTARNALSADEVARLQRQLTQAHHDIDQLEEMNGRERAQAQAIIRELQQQLKNAREPARAASPPPSTPARAAPKKSRARVADRVAGGDASPADKRTFAKQMKKKFSGSKLPPATPPAQPLAAVVEETPAIPPPAQPMTPPQSGPQGPEGGKAEVEAAMMGTVDLPTAVAQQAKTLTVKRVWSSSR